MNIEAYDLDSLRELARRLQKENCQLKQQLRQAAIPFDEKKLFEEDTFDGDYDPDQGARIINAYISENLANRFFGMFWGRTDVYAKRGTKGGYFPQCENRWNSGVCPKQHGEKKMCESCSYKRWTGLTPKTLVNHLLGYREDGADVVGIYPLFPDGTCRFLVFDFDNHEKGAEQTDFANEDDGWRSEVDALRKICKWNGLTPLVERSRSGKGAHLWIFFKSPIPAAKARNFGYLLLEKGELSVNLRSFRYYDRMYPSQDAASGLGNLIALPLQGKALKEGNSAFVDENWNAYPDQWKVLLQETKKIDRDEVDLLMSKWEAELATERFEAVTLQQKERKKPWERSTRFSKEDVVGKVHIVLGDGLYVDTLNLMPRIQNQIRGMAAFSNPVFEKNKKLGYSNYYNASTVYLGKDVDGYIQIPRGLRDTIEGRLRNAEIPYDIRDEREKGRPIRVAFNGDLRLQQQLAAQRMLSFDNGVLSAATAFGKTVVCSYLISERKVNTLILLQSKNLMEQWIDELERFLSIREERPKYKTKTGREKQRNSVIGCLCGSKNTLTGIVDVAMIGSLYARGKFNDLINSYGMVIMDECHHCGSDTSAAVMEKVNARYVYGVSATPQRSDQLDKMIFMLIGPVRHNYSAKERALEQGIGHYVYPRFTSVRDSLIDKNNINAAYTLVCGSQARNEMILKDTRNCIKTGRTPVILTRYKQHAAYLYENLKESADCVFLLYGDNSDKENSLIRRKLKEVPLQSTLILVATGQEIGEGFDCPRLDTLMLAAPVSFSGRLEQYLGRLNRDYEGKQDVIVYDYVDFHIRVFDNMYQKRLRTYRRIGFEIASGASGEKQQTNSIFDRGSYSDVFERDLSEAEKRIIISSPEIISEKVDRLIYLVGPRQEAGCKVTVITGDPQNIAFGSIDFAHELLARLEYAGIEVMVREDVPEHFAVIDKDLVWHGGMNLLGKEDAWDNLMRIRSSEIAEELLEIAFAEGAGQKT